MTSQSYEFCSVERINVCKKLRIISSSDFERHGTRDDGSIRALLSYARKKEEPAPDGTHKEGGSVTKCEPPTNSTNKHFARIFQEREACHIGLTEASYGGFGRNTFRAGAEHVRSTDATCCEHAPYTLRSRRGYIVKKPAMQQHDSGGWRKIHSRHKKGSNRVSQTGGPVAAGICCLPIAVPRRYQMETRSASGTNIGSASVTPNASYHAPMCGKAPFTRHSPREWTSIFVR